MARAKSSAVSMVTLGLYLGTAPLLVPQGALQDGMNFRIKQGRLGNLNLGWELHSAVTLDGPVVYQDTFRIRGLGEIMIFCTLKNVYSYDPNNDTVAFINPVYTTAPGVDVTSANPAVVTPDSGSPLWVTNGIKAGDMIHFGANNQTDPAAVWYTIATVGESSITLTTAVAGAPLNASAYTIRRTFTGDVQDIWDSETFVFPDDGTGDDMWFATNGVDKVITWDGQAAHAIRQTTLGFTCKRLSVFKNMMIYANLITDGGDSRPTSIANSDVGVPLDTSNGLASQFRVHDGSDVIMEVEDLGDNLVIYSERHVTQMQFVGDPLVWVLRDAAQGIGPIAPRVVADFGDYHEFIGADSQYLFDGVAVTEVGKQVWREVLRLRDPVRQVLAFTHFDEENGELHWLVPLTSDAGVGVEDEGPEISFVEHYLEEVGERVPTPYSRRELPFLSGGYSATAGVLTWDQLTQAWEDLTFRWNDSFLFSAFPLNLMGGADGRIYQINTVQQGAGSNLTSFVRFGRRPLGDGRMRGLLKRVYAFATKTATAFDVTTRYFDHANDSTPTIVQVDSFDASLPEGGHFVTPYRRGRYCDIGFGTSGAGWEVIGYDVDAVPGGRR